MKRITSIDEAMAMIEKTGPHDLEYNLPKGWRWQDTPSHGYLMVPHSGMEKIPADIQSTPYSHPGRYEEDCDWAVPVVCNAHLFDAEIVKRAVCTTINWNPNHFERLFNCSLDPEISHKKKDILTDPRSAGEKRMKQEWEAVEGKYTAMAS